MRKGNVFVITAPSGAGKTTLVRALLAFDRETELSVSYTTRAPRAGEVDGKDYHFVSREAFTAMLDRGDFLEHAEVYGNYYGTSKVWIERELARGMDIVLEIDVQGAEQIRKLIPDVISVFILPPSAAALEERLHARGLDEDEAIRRRLRAACSEMARVDEFDYIVINDKLDQSVADITALVRAARLRHERQQIRNADLLNELKTTCSLY